MAMLKKKPRPYETSGVGILNPYGDLWIDQVFKDPLEAIEYLERFFAGMKAVKVNDFRIVAVERRTEVSGLESWRPNEYRKRPTPPAKKEKKNG